MMKRKTNRLALPVFLVISIGARGDAESIKSVSPFLTGITVRAASLYVRETATRDGLLLLVLTNEELGRKGRQGSEFLTSIAERRPPFRYDFGSGQLKKSEAEDWKSAPGPIVDSVAQWVPTSGKPIRFHGSEHALLFNDKRIETAGRSVLRATLSPNRKYVADLSAEGEYRLGMVFGGTGASGKRFHQVFRNSDGTQIGETIVLADAPDKGDNVTQCWSPDGRWVVYHDAHFERVWITPGVEDSSKEKKP